MAIPATITPTTGSGATAASTANAVTSKASIAQNFDSFLKLLTTQLKNQNPLDPLDTNQFTQQLVQFAQVEQQMNMNTSLSSLIALQQTGQTTAALGYLGQTVTVSGDKAQLAAGHAEWSFTGTNPATATITVTSASGQTAFTGTFAVSAGAQNFTWDGRGNDGTLWPDGAYTMSITAKDTNGQSVAISTEVSGRVDAVDVTQTPPVLKIGQQSFTADQVKQVRRQGT